NPADPGQIVVTPDAQGWIAMPQDNNLLTGLFIPNLNMIVLATGAVTAWPHKDVGAVSAGTAAAAVGLVADRFFGIRLRVREVGNPASETIRGECQRLAVCDTLYDHVNKGGSWFPHQSNNQLAVCSVDVQELIVNGCADIGSDLTVLFTAAHPNLGTVSMS